MKRDSLLRAMIVMARAEDTEEGERQFNMALKVFENKIEKGMFFVLSFLSIVIFISAFIEYRGALDFWFRTIAGLFLAIFSLWRLNNLYGNQPATFIIRALFGRSRKPRRRR